jgi:acetyl-CoA acetyltransferase
VQGSLIFFPVQIVDPKTGEEKKVVISVDDGIRPGTTASGLAKLKPVFRKDGTTTAGIAALLAFFSADTTIATRLCLSIACYIVYVFFFFLI